MNTIKATAAAVIGARHLRMARNGQDAAAAWTGSGAGAIVVCDGCGSAGSSEVGALLGAQLVIRAIATRLVGGEPPSELWRGVRADVVSAIGALVDAMAISADPPAREAVIREHFLFTIVAAAVAGDQLSVWAVGDGAYAIGARVRVLGPFADNQPPYLGYELIGAPALAHVEHARAASGSLVVATDGAAEHGLDVAAILDDMAHPDRLRRRLALEARGSERIDWDDQRVVRAPAALQDDGAIAALSWEV